MCTKIKIYLTLIFSFSGCTIPFLTSWWNSVRMDAMLLLCIVYPFFRHALYFFISCGFLLVVSISYLNWIDWWSILIALPTSHSINQPAQLPIGTILMFSIANKIEHLVRCCTSHIVDEVEIWTIAIKWLSISLVAKQGCDVVTYCGMQL